MINSGGNNDSAGGSNDSRKLSVRLIEDEFEQDRRNSKHKGNISPHEFKQRGDGTLTPLLVMRKTKRLSIHPLDIDNFVP